MQGSFPSMTARILLIESARASVPSFVPSLKKKGYDVCVYNSLKGFLADETAREKDLVILDAASMRTSGARMVKKVADCTNGLPLILIVPEGACIDENNRATITLEQPFTDRKLLNRVARLVPADDSFLVTCGPIYLNLAQRSVRCMQRESRLTPKQTQLLEIFMRNPGRLITRRRLINLVWDTDYTGDTRTLDVHMSWLRKAIEPDPANPEFFITIRGVGYRLEITE